MSLITTTSLCSTNELFLTSAMKLHPYETALGKPTGYYLGWAQQEWDWFASSGLVNSQSLVNDGLNGSCVNNNQTTWTYNQGVLLNGAALLTTATGNGSALALASRIAAAAMTELVSTPGGSIMEEPCGAGGCDGDQHIFKGVFARHLSAMLQTGVVGPELTSQARAFLVANAESALANASCTQGSYGLLWQGPCGANVSVASTSAVGLDLFTAASLIDTTKSSSQLLSLGVGNCVDLTGASMPNCFNNNVTEAECSAAFLADTLAAAYDFQVTCGSAWGYCRVRTLSGASSCAPGWSFGGGNATNVTGANGTPLTECVLATA